MSRRMSSVITTALACTLAPLAAAFTAAAAPAVASSGSPTQVAVIPPDGAPNAIDDQIIMAGSTGFLHEYNFSSQYSWTTYSSGQTVQVSALAGVNPANIQPAGGDDVAFSAQPPSNPAGDVSEFDLATMTWQHWPVPSGYTAVREFGAYALVLSRPGGVAIWSVLNLSTQAVASISGIPAGASVAFRQATGNSSTAVLPYQVNSVGFQFALLDLPTATSVSIPDPDNASQLPVLSADRVALYDSATEVVRVYSRAGLTGGSDTTATTVTLPAASANYVVALAGDRILAVQGTRECLYCVYTTAPALAAQLSGPQAGQTSQVLAQAQTGPGAVAQAPGGAPVLVGGAGPGDWSVRQFTVGSGGNLVDTPVLALTGPMSNGGVSISQGLVRHIEVQAAPFSTGPRYLLFNHELITDSSQNPIANPRLNGGILQSPVPCAQGATCLRTVDGNGYGTSYLADDVPAGSIDLRQQIDGYTSTMSVSLPSASGSVVDASDDYVIVDGASPPQQYLVYVGYRQIINTGPVTGAALWFDTLWTSDGPGYIQPRALSINTMETAGTPIATGSDCTATEIQATERWIYWSCGTTGPAGVYDLRTKVDIHVPAGPALLGDGYLVQHDPATGNLNLYDVHTDAVSGPITLANVPVGPGTDDRGITWAVDKYSGDVAYVAADDSVHVVDTGVPATPPAATNPESMNGGGQLYFGSTLQWDPYIVLSRPITGWTMTIRQLSTGRQVLSQSAGPVRFAISTSWNGYLTNGKKAFSGRYGWSVTVTTPDGAPPVTFAGGTVTVNCGQLPFRSYDCSGVPSLLADNNIGESVWFNGTDTGGLRSNEPGGGYSENWPLCQFRSCVATIVPFGDINGDGFGDLIVLYRSGVLRAYLGFGQSYFNAQVVKSVRIGTGWNIYNAVAAPGNLTANGQPYLIARDHQGRLWRYTSTGKASLLRRAKIGGGWGGYVRLVGAGDLNGDGIGDLLAIGKNGAMWRFDGNGRGGFLQRRYVSSGWSKYNIVIGIGDLNNDGCNDLVARDRQGTLWFFAGNCRGGFARPTVISRGWNRYKMLF